MDVEWCIVMAVFCLSPIPGRVRTPSRLADHLGLAWLRTGPLSVFLLGYLLLIRVFIVSSPPRCNENILLCFLKCFTVFHLTFMSLLHLEFIFVFAMR